MSNNSTEYFVKAARHAVYTLAVKMISGHGGNGRQRAEVAFFMGQAIALVRAGKFNDALAVLSQIEKKLIRACGAATLLKDAEKSISRAQTEVGALQDALSGLLRRTGDDNLAIARQMVGLGAFDRAQSYVEAFEQTFPFSSYDYEDGADELLYYRVIKVILRGLVLPT
jgi:hypothetical protein